MGAKESCLSQIKNYPMEGQYYHIIFLLWDYHLHKDLFKIPYNIPLLAQTASQQRSFLLLHLTHRKLHLKCPLVGFYWEFMLCLLGNNDGAHILTHRHMEKYICTTSPKGHCY